MRSNEVRRINARFSAAGAGESPFRSRAERMKRSIGDFGQALDTTDGGLGSRTGWKAQNESFPSGTAGWLGVEVEGAIGDLARSSEGQEAPVRTHSTSSANSGSGSFPFGGILISSW